MVTKVKGAAVPYESGTFTPVANAFTVTGTPVYSGSYIKYSNLVVARIVIDTAGGSIASTAGLSYFTSLPYVPSKRSGVHVSDSNIADYGIGHLDTAGKVLTPTWSAKTSTIVLEISYEVA